MVYHKLDPTKEPLTPVKSFHWLGRKKIVCINSTGEFTKDWEEYFVDVDDNCTCEVAGTNDCWYIDVHGYYRCGGCYGMLGNQHVE